MLSPTPQSCGVGSKPPLVAERRLVMNIGWAFMVPVLVMVLIDWFRGGF